MSTPGFRRRYRQFSSSGLAIGAATAAVVANSLGFAEDAPAETLRTVAFWTFAAFVPVTLVGCWSAWRLSQFAVAGSERFTGRCFAPLV